MSYVKYTAAIAVSNCAQIDFVAHARNYEIGSRQFARICACAYRLRPAADRRTFGATLRNNFKYLVSDTFGMLTEEP